ncbi:hypothetical protein K435DRAFT_796379 [Dendrothele bispora CBS 962.96]|uniref:Endonuclease/exonuclease/phosphatase domain-containing protein n=1 Tax=Dendrothele bispora (strain CBS 962.96) TaxID=1314807 RepID=A0A4S8M5Q4_DENBC|nr:hypothetical protein K435DRAFT_796379 [Dendrothele bispora CBS 962.96]
MPISAPIPTIIATTSAPAVSSPITTLLPTPAPAPAMPIPTSTPTSTPAPAPAPVLTATGPAHNLPMSYSVMVGPIDLSTWRNLNEAAIAIMRLLRNVTRLSQQVRGRRGGPNSLFLSWKSEAEALAFYHEWHAEPPKGYENVSMLNVNGDLRVKLERPEFKNDFKNFDVIFYQETHLRPNEHECIQVPDGFQMFVKSRPGPKDLRRPWGGVITFARTELNASVRNDLSSTDILSLEIQQCILVNAYILPVNSTSWMEFTDVHPFEHLLRILIATYSMSLPVLIMGDLNARTGITQTNTAETRSSSDTTTCGRGSRLLRELQSTGYSIVNGCMKLGPTADRATSFHGSSTTPTTSCVQGLKVIDYTFSLYLQEVYLAYGTLTVGSPLQVVAHPLVVFNRNTYEMLQNPTPSGFITAHWSREQQPKKRHNIIHAKSLAPWIDKELGHTFAEKVEQYFMKSTKS